jgi:uncharacterized protein (DUF58 family)
VSTVAAGDLEVPAARQGPGPLPAALVEGLELPLARRGARSFPGDRRAPSTGAGTELARLRAYQPGDDVRHLDAAASARTGVPHVRLHVPERTLTTWVVLDVSPSMAFGTARRLKADVAEGAALVLGRLAVKRGGGLALVSFGSNVPMVLPPRSSRPALLAMRRVLAEGVAPDGHCEPTGLAQALERVGRLARAPGLVAVISDFRDQQAWSRPLGALTARHAVLAIEISDPRERELPAVGRLAVVDPESGRRIEVNTSRRRIRDRFAALERERAETLARELRRRRVEHLMLSTAGDWLREMGRGLR